jgi:hypothetical protein
MPLLSAVPFFRLLAEEKRDQQNAPDLREMCLKPPQGCHIGKTLTPSSKTNNNTFASHALFGEVGFAC